MPALVGARTLTQDGSIIHIFTSSGIFTPQFTGNVEVLAVAGGGGGGMDMGGGGGGGGVLTSTTIAATAGTPIVVTVGAGGAGAPAGGENGQNTSHQFTIAATNGSNTVISTLTAVGGGKGGSSYFGYTPDNGYGGNGGSGGGASGYSDGNTGRAGTGTAGQGNNGGGNSGQYYAGGGGGAGAVGGSGTGVGAAVGGVGVLNSILGVDYYWGGGGGGASYSVAGGAGGNGGGGASGTTSSNGGLGFNIGGPGGNRNNSGTQNQLNLPGGDGGRNTGGGGGGGSHYTRNNRGGNGGSGIVIIKYPASFGKTSTGGNIINTSSLVLCLDATNSKSYPGTGTTWNDLSGKGNAGTLGNSPTYSNGTIVLNGSNTYISFTNPITPSQAYTVIQWARPSTALVAGSGGTNPSGVNRRTPLVGPGPVWNPGIWVTSDNIRVHSNTDYRDLAITWTDTTYRMIGQTFDGSQSRIIYNGLVYAGASVGYSPTAPATILVGAETTTGSSVNWLGDIPITMFFKRVLTDGEIKQIFNAFRGRFGV